MIRHTTRIQDKYTLYKSNLAIRVSNNLTAVERKFFNQILIIAQHIGLEITDYQSFARIFDKILGNSNRQSHLKLKDIFDRLMSKIINIIDAYDKNFNKTTYLAGCELKDGIFNFELSNRLKKYICINMFDIQGNKSVQPYTKLNLNIINTLTSTHSIALYEFAKSSIFATKEINIDLETLRDMICSNTKYYQDFRKFNEKILQKAIKEINAKTDIKIVICEAIKGYNNKTVEKIRFIVEKQNDNPIIIKQTATKNTKQDKKLKLDINCDIDLITTSNEIYEDYINVEPLKEAAKPKNNTYPLLVNQLQEIGIKPLSKILKWHAEDKELLQSIYDEVTRKYADKKDVEKQKLIASMFQDKINPNFISPTEKLALEQKKVQDALKQEKNRRQYEEAEAKRIAKQQLIEQNTQSFQQELNNTDSQISRIWHKFIKLANIPDNQKMTWIDPLTAQVENENTLKIIAPNSIKADFFRKQLSNHIEQAVKELQLNYKIQISSY